MARPKVADTQKKTSATASVTCAVKDTITELALARQWSHAKAAGFLIERGAQAEGLLPKPVIPKKRTTGSVAAVS